MQERELASTPMRPDPPDWRLPALLVGVLVISLLVMAACQPQQRPEIDRSEVREMVEDEVQSQWTIDRLEEITQREVIVPLIEEALESPEFETMLQEKMIEIMESPDFETALLDAMEELIDSPEAQQRVEDAVRRALEGMIGGAGGQQEGGGDS